MFVDELILRIGAPLIVLAICGLSHWFYGKQRTQDLMLQSLHEEQIRLDERQKAHSEGVELRLSTLEKRLDKIDDKLENLPAKVAEQIRREFGL